MPEFENEGTGRREILGTRLMKKAWKLVLQTSSCEKNMGITPERVSKLSARKISA